MTIRFAAAIHPARISARGIRRAPPANDNGAAAVVPLPREALLHFAEHGLGAAKAARQQAEQAFFSGDRDAYHRWLGICRMFDRRMAAAVDLGEAGGGQRG